MPAWRSRDTEAARTRRRTPKNNPPTPNPPTQERRRVLFRSMAAYAEGLNILRHADAGLRSRDTDAETTPLRNPEYYRYELDLPDTAELWRRGSVIGSWLLDLTARARLDDPGLEGYAGRVSDSGEGRWTVEAGVGEGVPAHAISAALFSRFESRGEAGYADRLLSAMRKQFGGHDEKK